MSRALLILTTVKYIIITLQADNKGDGGGYYHSTRLCAAISDGGNRMAAKLNLVMRSFYNLKNISIKEEVNCGLDRNRVVEEQYPLWWLPKIISFIVWKSPEGTQWPGPRLFHAYYSRDLNIYSLDLSTKYP